MIAAGTVWGLSPIFYKAIAHVPPMEVLSHRAVFSFVTFLLVLLWQGRTMRVFAVLAASPGRFATVVLAALLIGSNWLLFVVAVQSGQTTQASLGYFIFPLIAVFLGSVLLRERLGLHQWVAVGVTAAAVAYMSFATGEVPILAIFLASTFAIYGLMKKRSNENAVVSVSAESLILTPFALVWLVGVHAYSWPDFTGRPGGWFGQDLLTSALLAMSGLMTAGPLVLMSYAMKRIRYSEGGFLLYTNPTLQFLTAVLLFREPFTSAQLLAFVMIWAALVVFTFEAEVISAARYVSRLRQK